MMHLIMIHDLTVNEILINYMLNLMVNEILIHQMLKTLFSCLIRVLRFINDLATENLKRLIQEQGSVPTSEVTLHLIV